MTNAVIVAIIGASGAVLGGFGVQFLSIRVCRCNKFRDAFTDVLAGLRTYKATESLVCSNIAKHGSAIEEFRRGLNRKHWLDFDKDCDYYRKCRHIFLDYAGRIGRSDDIPAAGDFRRAIEHLMTYTDKHWLYPVLSAFRKMRKDFLRTLQV